MNLVIQTVAQMGTALPDDDMELKLNIKPVIKSKTKHKIIATLFCDNPNNYTIVNHINHIRHDNRADNLEWCDLKDNIREQEHGLSSLSKSIKYTKTDGSIIVFESIAEASEYFGVTRANIRHRLKNPIVQRIKSNWLQGGSITYNN